MEVQPGIFLGIPRGVLAVYAGPRLYNGLAIRFEMELSFF